MTKNRILEIKKSNEENLKEIEKIEALFEETGKEQESKFKFKLKIADFFVTFDTFSGF